MSSKPANNAENRPPVASVRSSDPTGGAGSSGQLSVKAGFRIKIGWKITAVVVVVMTVLAFVNILFIRDRFERTMDREFESKAKAIALSIARSSEDKLVSQDIGAVQSLVDTYKGVHGVSYIMIQDSGGNLVVGTFDKGVSEGLLQLTPLTGEEDFKLSRFEIEEVGDILEVAVPVLFGVAGTVRVGVDHGLIATELFRLTERLITQFAIASIFGVILLHLIVIFLLRHIQTVLDVLVKVRDGDFTARANVATRDEFSDLAYRGRGSLEVRY